MSLETVLEMAPINIPDADFRIQSAWRQLAVMVLEEAWQDGELAPVELPQKPLSQPYHIQDTPIIEV